MILKISLQPLDNFFFGGESSFNEAGMDEFRRATYVLRSRYFPQQTGALGLVRNQLLLQSGLLKDNTAKVKDRQRAEVLIGKKGFRIGSHKAGFGVIKKLSPVFLEATDGKVCVPAPLDDVLVPTGEEEGGPKQMVFELEKAGGAATKALLRNYREKAGVYKQFQHPEKGNAQLEQLFTPQQRVGITKAARSWGNTVKARDDESGYYFQTFLSFKTGQKLSKEGLPFYIQGFCFYVELAEQTEKGEIGYEWSGGPIKNLKENQYTLQHAIVEFGGERSTFNMLVEKLEGPNWSVPATSYKNTHISEKNKENISRLVCLSPSYIQDIEKLRSLTHLRVTETVPFRFLKSSVGSTSRYQEVHRRNGGNPGEKSPKSVMAGMVESKLFHLADRGSVYYFDSANRKQVEGLFQHIDFQTIGYNQYHIL